MFDMWVFAGVAVAFIAAITVAIDEFVYEIELEEMDGEF